MKKQKKKKKTNPCDGCLWGKRIDERKMFCPMPKCVKGIYQPWKRRGGQDGSKER